MSICLAVGREGGGRKDEIDGEVRDGFRDVLCCD